MASPSQSCLGDVPCSASGPGTLQQMPEPDFVYIQAHMSGLPEVSHDTNAFRIRSFSYDGVCELPTQHHFHTRENDFSFLKISFFRVLHELG